MSPHASEIRVLHVDDEELFADLTAESLELADDRLHVETATSAREGLELLGDPPPDCVVSDYDMPQMDGLEFLETVRAEHPGVPFILFTGQGSESIAGDAISAGVTDYLQKRTGTEQFELLANRITNAVTAHQAQQRATDRLDELQQILRTVPAAVMRVDSQAAVVFANQRATEMLGVEATGEGGQSYTDLPWRVAPPDGDPLSESKTPLGQVLATGDPVEGDRYDIVWPDGTRRTVEVHARPLFDDGAVESVVLSLSDVTDEMTRRRELERHETFLEYSPDTITVISESGTVEYQSATPDEPCGFQMPNLAGESPQRRLHPDDRRRALSAYERVRAADPGEMVRTEFRLQGTDGEYRWFESQMTNYIGRDPVDGLLAATREITGRKKTEQSLARYASTVTQLQKATRRLLDTTDREEVAEITVEGLEQAFEFDIAGIWLSNADRSRLDPTAITEQGQRVVESPPTYSAETPSLSWEAFETGQSRLVDDMSAREERHNPDTPIQSELIVPLGEHGLLNIGSTERSAFDGRDRHRVELWATMVTSALARLDQIERLKQRERELQRERDRLDEFAGFVSHDLRNPLNVATGRLELVADDCSSPHLDSIERSLDRMDQLIEDVLELARQGATVGERETVDLEQLFPQCWQNVRTADAELVVDRTCVVRADSSRLASAVENIFANAITHGGEDVTVTAGALADGTGIYLADDGPGIPESERDQVFDGGYSTTADGTGFGLAIVRQVVAAHGWEMTVSESADGGARFEITGVDIVE